MSGVNLDSQQYYYVPETQNYPAIDAIVPPFVCLQITIWDKHAINFNGLEKVMRRLLKVCGQRRNGDRKRDLATLLFHFGRSGEAFSTQGMENAVKDIFSKLDSVASL